MRKLPEKYKMALSFFVSEKEGVLYMRGSKMQDFMEHPSKLSPAWIFGQVNVN